METVAEYREWLFSMSLSPKTVKIYVRVIERVTVWCEERDTDITMLRPSQLALLTGETPPGSRRQLRSALQHYWTMLGMQGPSRAIRVPPKPRPRWKGLQPDEAQRLLRTARAHPDRGGVVIVGIYLGARREEIANLRWDWFDKNLSWVRIIGKRDVARHLPVHPKLRSWLVTRAFPSAWVFPGRFGGHISVGTVSLWLEELAQEAGLGHVHPHQLRYTTISCINDEVGLLAARDFAGHVSVETTEIYSQTQVYKLIAGVRALDRLEDGAA